MFLFLMQLDYVIILCSYCRITSQCHMLVLAMCIVQETRKPPLVDTCGLLHAPYAVLKDASEATAQASDVIYTLHCT